VKIALVDALEKLGETLPEAVAYLARLAADSRSGVNKQAETALEQLGVPQRLVVSRLVDLLEKSDDEDVLYQTCVALGHLKATEAVDSLVKRLIALHDEVVSVQASATRGLAAMKPESAKLLPLLDAGLRHENPQARISSARLLSRFIREPMHIDQAIRLLDDMKADIDLPVRDAVENALKVLKALR